QLAFYQESTQGTPPANGAEWVSSGKRIRHIGDELDISGIAQAAVDDMRSQIHVDAVNLKAKGLKNTEFSFSIYLTGYGSKVESGSSNTEIDMGTLLKHALGGQLLGTSLTASGTHSTTTVEVADASSLEVGQYIGIEQGGVVYPRRIIDIADDVITYDEATPAAPQNDDIVRAFVTHYIDEEVLIDSAAGPYTFSWLIQKGLGSAGFDTVQLQGCKAALTGIEVSRGELAKLTFTVQAASFTDDRDAPNPEWVGSPTGNAPVVVG